MIVVYKDKKAIEFPDLSIKKTKDCIQALKQVGIEWEGDINLATLEEMGIGLKNY